MLLRKRHGDPHSSWSLAIRRVSSISVLLLTLLASMATGFAPASAGPGESYFTSRINGERGSRGIRAYAVRGDLTSVARNHAARMAARRTYYHNPNLGSEVRGWRAVAENVGKGSDAASLHRAFMRSSSHRANILSTRYTEVGVGTATDSSGTLYVVQIFRLPSGSTTYRAPTRTAAPTTTARPATRSRVPARASRSGRRAVATAPPRPVGLSPAVLLRRRLSTAATLSARADRAGVIAQMVVWHDVAVHVGGH